jgi:XTP/dITP diphosphohydrolase
LDLIVLATGNEGKAEELRALLHPLGVRIRTLRDHPAIALPPETGSTYRENAILKSRAVHEALGVPALGDDSGLEVDALDGAPGLHSARYAGPHAGDEANNRKLLDSMEGIPWAERTARFRCVLALVRDRNAPLVVEGLCLGRVLPAPRGGRGFGYDPLFLPDGEDLTFAELPPDRKASISHRGRAARALVEALRAR